MSVSIHKSCSSCDINFNAIFAPGTHINLATNLSGNNIQWAFIAFESNNTIAKNDTKTIKNKLSTINPIILLDKQMQANKHYNVFLPTKKDSTKISFSLPITRDKKEKMFKKYYIIVFAYNADNISLDNISSASYIIMDMSFRVGYGEDSNVGEFKGIQKDTIHNISQATQYLRMTYEDCKSKKLKLNEYFIKYPRIAGKIGYIYYRFDLSNDNFIDNTKNSKEYKQDRDKFIDGVKYVFENKTYESKILNKNITFKKAYSDSGIIEHYHIFDRHLSKNSHSKQEYIDERIEFIKGLIKEICGFFLLPLNNITIKRINERARFIYDYNDEKKYEIIINEELLYNSVMVAYNDEEFELLANNLIETAIHECRHFYVHNKFYKRQIYQNDFIGYLCASLDFFIMELNDNMETQKIFSSYIKKCDSVENQNVGCPVMKNTYFQSLYEIQPSERDSRYIAHKSIIKLNI